MPLIKLENISQVFGFSEATTIALDQIHLEVEKGDFIAIMGPSGSGKTTLLNILGLITSPTKGSYIFAEQEVTEMTQARKAKFRQQKIGFIFQDNNLLPNLNILDNVSLPLLYSGNLGAAKRTALVQKLLTRLGVHRKEYLYPYQLNGGHTQKVAIARAIINQPTAILADEPAGNLDSVSSKVIMQILKNINEEGGTILIATHNPALTKYANRIIYIQDGRIRIDQILARDQQVDLGKMQDAVKRQDLRQERQNQIQNEAKDELQITSYKGESRKARIKKLDPK